MPRECAACGEIDSAAFPLTLYGNRFFCGECMEDLGYSDEIDEVDE